jgi:hypothetical protein
LSNKLSKKTLADNHLPIPSLGKPYTIGDNIYKRYDLTRHYIPHTPFQEYLHPLLCILIGTTSELIGSKQSLKFGNIKTKTWSLTIISKEEMKNSKHWRQGKRYFIGKKGRDT